MANPVERSKRYLKWLRRAVKYCQFSGLSNVHLVAMHPPRGRPWGGGMGLKASDYGCLMGKDEVNVAESEDRVGLWKMHRNLPERDLAAIGNLRRYVEEELDPGVDLWWDMVDYALRRVRELEEERG